MKYVDILESDEDFNRDYGRYDASKDEVHKQDIHSTRKPLMTLKIVNRMKKMRATRKLEMCQQQDIMQLMYQQPSDGGGDSGPPGF